MNKIVREALERELSEAERQEARSELVAAWQHWERAHILSQRDAEWHTRVHVHMLAIAVRRGDVRGALGQVIRTVVAGRGSLLGRAPIGNTGASSVGILQPMPIPDDLQAILSSE